MIHVRPVNYRGKTLHWVAYDTDHTSIPWDSRVRRVMALGSHLGFSKNYPVDGCHGRTPFAAVHKLKTLLLVYDLAEIKACTA